MDEEESTALAGYLDDSGEDPASNALLETELRRVAVRLDLPQSAASAVLVRVALVEPTRSLFYEAGILPGPALRSLDAIHLATVLRLDTTVLVAYDERLLAAARDLGLDVASPS